MFKSHMHTVLTDMDKPADLIAEILQVLEDQRKNIVL